MAVIKGALSGALSSGTLSVPTSVQSDWVVAHQALTATDAAEGTALLRPFTFAGTSVMILEVSPHVTRFIPRARYPQASTLTTNAVVRFYGVNGIGPVQSAAGVWSFADDGTNEALRLDNADANAAGITFTLSATADLRDTTFAYTDPPDLTGYDLKGARWLLCLPETKAVISAGTMTLRVKGLN